MVNKSKAIGTKYENEVKEAMIESIGNAYRCGIAAGHPGDVSFRAFGNTYFIECKRRGEAWTELYKWLAGTTVKGKKRPNDFIALRANNQRTLIVMDFESFSELFNAEVPKPKRGLA